MGEYCLFIWKFRCVPCNFGNDCSSDNVKRTYVNFQEFPEGKYTPPMTIRVTDCRKIGGHVLAGSYVINSLEKYIQKADEYENMIGAEKNTNRE